MPMICAEPSSSSVLCLQVLSLRHRRLVRPSPESIQSRSRWLRPTCASKPWRRSKPNMAGTRNPFGRRPHPGSRIHLRKGHGRPACFPIQKTAAKRNLGKAVRKAALAANENRREISRVSRIPANGSLIGTMFSKFLFVTSCRIFD